MKETYSYHLSTHPVSSLPVVATQSAASQSLGAKRSGKRPLELPSHEVLSRLACEDPQKFELLRRELVESFIENAPARVKPRLRGIQFRVECVRRLSRSALGSAVGVYELMWTSFLRLNGAWQETVHLKEGCMEGRVPGLVLSQLSTASAQILEFKPRPHDPN
jgi:hypothetical protein